MGAQLSRNNNNIEEYYRSLNSMLDAAKFGRWVEVWAILGTPDKPLKAYLLNSIPAERRWSVLHQAVYWRDQTVIETILKFDTCDSGVMSKEGTCEAGPAGGKTPRDVAKQFGYEEIMKLLEEHPCKKVWSQKIPTFHLRNDVAYADGFGLLRITLAAYKDTFHPLPIHNSSTVQELMNDIFKHVNRSDNWKMVRDKVSQPLFPVCKSATSTLDGCKTKEDFFQELIKIYTDEDARLYTYVNTALRRQKRHNYMPTAVDLAIGPYILMFNLLLRYWEEAGPKETNITYRQMNLTDNDSHAYQPDTVFVWISFGSSSVRIEDAKPFPTCEAGPTGDVAVMFVIDNSNESPLRPRDIEKYSTYQEYERVYPAGAPFSVISRKDEGGITTIHIKLLGDYSPIQI